MKIECDIVKDLLPLYVEQLASEKSRAAVEEHLEECEECRKIHDEMKAPRPSVQYDREPAESFYKYVKKERRVLGIKVATVTAIVSTVLAVLAAVILHMFVLGGAMGMLAWLSSTAEVQEDTDVSHYSWYMGENAEDVYINKGDMDESIFPKEITDEMNVIDYKMVYYNPWDRQWLSYLVAEYEEEQYHREVERLEEYVSTEYLGYYGAEGFAEGYTLLAMEADSYHGFIYALAAEDHQIIYVELIFSNYFYDLEYQDMIREEYLPLGFDATVGNAYRQQLLGK